MLIKLDKIIEQFDLDIRGVLHIGAHYGQEYKDYARHGVDNMIFFEPVKATFEKLLTVLPKKPNIYTLNIALGNETGYKEMFLETDNRGQSCSLLEPGTHLTLHPHISFHGKEIVKIYKLDNIAFNRDNYNMINIDVQGFELEVFRGAVDTLNTIDYIYTEINKEGCCHVSELDGFLGDYGFMRVLTKYPDRTTQEKYPWGDALYLKK